MLTPTQESEWWEMKTPTEIAEGIFDFWESGNCTVTLVRLIADAIAAEREAAARGERERCLAIASAAWHEYSARMNHAAAHACDRIRERIRGNEHG